MKVDQRDLPKDISNQPVAYITIFMLMLLTLNSCGDASKGGENNKKIDPRLLEGT